MMAMANTSVAAVLEEFGFSEKWETRGLEKGLQKGREEAVRGLQKYGMDPKQISEALELPLGTVFQYLKAHKGRRRVPHSSLFTLFSFVLFVGFVVKFL
jgi:predicted transposase YdaD